MPPTRMNREEFFATLAPLDEVGAKKASWSLYWRGTSAMRERIERELAGDQRHRTTPAASEQVDAHSVLAEIGEFAALARAGAYLAGDRRVSPRQRTRWRFTFQRLAADTRRALHGDDIDDAAAAMEELIDLACAMRAYDYFRSDDPVEAARFVVSDAVTLLWARLLDTGGFAVFADRAAPQLIRWESPYGWTRRGWGRVSEQETTLAAVLVAMLPAVDMWITFADRYLDALDHIGGGTSTGRRVRADRGASERARNLAEWHRRLFDRLTGTDAEDRLDTLANHPALGGPELRFLQAQLACHRGDTRAAHDLVHDCLRKLPGHPDFLEFAAKIGAALPPPAAPTASQRRTTDEPATPDRFD